MHVCMNLHVVIMLIQSIPYLFIYIYKKLIIYVIQEQFHS